MGRRFKIVLVFFVALSWVLLDKRTREQNSFELGMLHRTVRHTALKGYSRCGPMLGVITLCSPSPSPLHDCLQVNARNAERALNQEKLESSKLRQR